MWTTLFKLVLAGNMLMGRSFAYWGFQPAKIFIGEAALVMFSFGRPSDVFGRWFWSLCTRNPSGAFSWAVLLFAEYGIFEVWRGVNAGYGVAGTIQNFAYNCYPLYFFVGWWLGETCPSFLPGVMRWFAWMHGLYALAYILVLDKLALTLPGSPWVSLFGQPNGAALSIFGLLCFNARLRPVMMPLMLNSFVLLAMQVRAEWLAFMVGLLIWCTAIRRIGPVFAAGTAVVCLVLIGYIVDFQLPGTSGRGGTVSARSLIARGIAPVNEELAVSMGGANARVAAATFNWRVEWWKDIWKAVHEKSETAALGFGYGFPLASVTNVPMPSTGAPVRTPHSIFYYALGYTGWIGVVLFFYLQLQLAVLLWRAYVVSGQPFGMIACSGLFAWAFFDAAFEAPYRAIPFFLIAGLSAAPLLAFWQRRASATSYNTLRVRSLDDAVSRYPAF